MWCAFIDLAAACCQNVHLSCLWAAPFPPVMLVRAGLVPWYNRKNFQASSTISNSELWGVHFLLDPSAELTHSRATGSSSASRRCGNAWLRVAEDSILQSYKMRCCVKTSKTLLRFFLIQKYFFDTAAAVLWSWLWHLCVCTRVFNLL